MPNVELQGEPGTGVAEDIIGRLLPEWWGRFQPKNKAYGGALAIGGGLGIKAFIPEINRKVSGIVNEIWHGAPRIEGSEGAREKAMDLIGHLFILVSNLDAQAEGGPRVGFDIAAIVDQAAGASQAARLTGGDGKAAGVNKVDEILGLTRHRFYNEAGVTEVPTDYPKEETPPSVWPDYMEDEQGKEYVQSVKELMAGARDAVEAIRKYGPMIKQIAQHSEGQPTSLPDAPTSYTAGADWEQLQHERWAGAPQGRPIVDLHAQYQELGCVARNCDDYYTNQIHSNHTWVQPATSEYPVRDDNTYYCVGVIGA